MSTPFPLEEGSEDQSSRPQWDPWSGPAPAPWNAGLGFDENTAYLGPAYRVLEAMGSGAAKGAAVLNGLEKTVYGGLGDLADTVGAGAPFRYLEQGAEANTRAARQAVADLTPSAATTGTAVQLLHGVTEGAYLMSTGAVLGGAPGAAAVVGGVEGPSRYQELKEQGVDTTTAAASGAVTGITSAAGALMPAAYGSTLLTRVLTGAASNVGFGAVTRFADHQILASGGYPEMADQQKVLDGTQILIDAALGSTFGLIHHLTAPEARAVEALNSPDNRDAALTANLALRDRQAAPGVAADPESANAHQAAMIKAGEDLAQGRPVDVSETGVASGRFLSRPTRDLSPEANLLLRTFKESGLLDEEANLRDMEEAFAAMRSPPDRTTAQPMTDQDSNVTLLRLPETEQAADIGSFPIDAANAASARKPWSQRLKPIDMGGASADELLAKYRQPIPGDAITQAFAERPDLEVPQDGTPVNAREALDTATANTATAESEIPSAIEAATNCFTRRGS